MDTYLMNSALEDIEWKWFSIMAPQQYTAVIFIFHITWRNRKYGGLVYTSHYTWLQCSQSWWQNVNFLFQITHAPLSVFLQVMPRI